MGREEALQRKIVKLPSGKGRKLPSGKEGSFTVEKEEASRQEGRKRYSGKL